jgi:chemotaxis protein MotB
VLTVMLVITLMALTDFKSAQNAVLAKASRPLKLAKAPAPTSAEPEQKAKLPDSTVTIDHVSKQSNHPLPSPEIASAEKTLIIAAPPRLIDAPKKIEPTPPPSQGLQDFKPIQPLATPAEQEFKPIPPVLRTEPETKPLPEQSLDNEKRLQQQLTKTINEFGLNEAVHIRVNQGYAQLEIQDKVLFKSSQADLTTDGAAVLKRLTPLLKEAEGLILIEGHTDNLPINTPQFPSNWELGSSRATSVLHFLASQQLDSTRMRAITYADTMPIADNTTREGREKNRRVSILIKVSEQQL